MEGRGDNPDPATLFDRPTAVSSDPRLAASVAMLAALEGKAEVVGRITLAPGAPPEAAAAFAVARRAVGLAAPGAAAALEDLDVLRDWDRIGCLRRQRAPWLTHASQGAGCAGGDLGAFERRWQAQFSSRYAAALVGSPNGPAFVAADPRFGPLDRWAAAQRVSGRSPWISGALRILLLLAVAAVCIAAVVVNRMYDSVFAPMHFESRRRQGHLDPETRAP
jgi:hypothetical protein